MDLKSGAPTRRGVHTIHKMRTVFVISCAITCTSLIAAVAAAPSAIPAVQFTDITQKAGIHFRQNAGKAGKKYLPETMGSGVALFDYNNDGKLDILLINGRDWNPHARSTPCALYRNNGNGTFTDVTAGSGLGVGMYGLGVSVA